MADSACVRDLAPANDHVEYVEHHFTAALLNKTEYMGYPDDEIDKRWSDLYNSTSSSADQSDKNGDSQ